ncbi:acetate--CoA ligase family protein [Streptomyces bathyalis]|uniref:acetate--CoA ligase family protein n=1 Tax=Streptomyces bathyalis TaxID=2710756 RepID=UPI001FEBA4C6|nr:acetate--CoA ligase family protein [Streptomyces bathyalis]
MVGASQNPAKWGYWLAKGALAGAHRRTVHLVNRRGGELLGTPFLPALDALPRMPEHVVVAVPSQEVRPIVTAGLAGGARCFTVISSGAGNRQEERELADLVTRQGARLLGPNCMGVLDTTSELRLSWGDFPAGTVGLVSQSGNLALEIGRLLARAGQGFSRFVSLGNQRDIDAADALDSLIAHEETRALAAYVEDFRDGRRLARTMAAAHAAGKPVLLLTVGRSDASERAAASHTGALVSARATVEAVCGESGALLLDTAGELVDTAVCLLAARAGGEAGTRDGIRVRSPEPDPGPARVAVVGDSGGQGALAADTFAAHGLDVPALPEATASAVAAHLPHGAGCGNPVDLAGAGERDLGNYSRIAGVLLHGGDVDAVVLTGYFGDYATADPAQTARECETAGELADAAASSGRTLVVHTMARDTAAIDVLRRRGIPVYERIEQAARALAGAAKLRAARPQPRCEPTVRARTPAQAPLSDGGYETVRKLIASYGLATPAAEFVTSVEEGVEAAHRVGYPVVLKAMGLPHRTDAGGIALGIEGERALLTAFARMREATGAPRYAVEAMATPRHAVELIAGVRRDPAFGPVAMVGIGGVAAELLADTVLATAPLTPERAHEMLLSLRHTPLLTGWRGAPPVRLDMAAGALCSLARAAVEHAELSELEVNPLLVHPDGAIALDAHAVVELRP